LTLRRKWREPWPQWKKPLLQWRKSEVSKTIWKYNLPRDGETIEIHQHIVEVLHIGA
jgi:hypothetical protein